VEREPEQPLLTAMGAAPSFAGITVDGRLLTVSHTGPDNQNITAYLPLNHELLCSALWKQTLHIFWINPPQH
jgi:hypothetical protein